MAVFPTPGSPIRTGLFFVLRDSTCRTLLISWSRPITGSSFPLAARSFRFLPYFSSDWNVSSGFCPVTRPEPRTSFNIFSMLSFVTPLELSSSPSLERLLSVMPSRRCSTETYSSFNLSASLVALSRSSASSREIVILPAPAPETLGYDFINSSTRDSIRSRFTPTFIRMELTIPSFSIKRAWNK